MSKKRDYFSLRSAWEGLMAFRIWIRWFWAWFAVFGLGLFLLRPDFYAWDGYESVTMIDSLVVNVAALAWAGMFFCVVGGPKPQPQEKQQ